MLGFIEKNKFVLGSAALIAALLLLVTLPGDIGFEGGTWIVGQWGITYVYGFVFRGFMGSILEVIDVDVTTGVLYVIYAAAMAVYSAALAWLGIRFYKKTRNIYSLLFVLFMFVQPFITQWWFSEVILFRLDIFIVAAFLLALIIAGSVKIKKAVKYILICAVSFVAMLIHEGFAVLFFPCIFAFVMFVFNKDVGKNSKADLRPVFFLLLPAVAAYLIIVAFGKADAVDTTMWATISSNIFKKDLSIVHVREVLYMGIFEKMKNTLPQFTAMKLYHLLLTMLLMSPSLFIFVKLWQSVFVNGAPGRKSRIILIMLAVFCFSPVLCYLVGIDTMRWYGFIILNNVFIISALAINDSSLGEKAVEVIKKYRIITAAAVILAVILGPASYVNGFDIVGRLIGWA